MVFAHYNMVSICIAAAATFIAGMFWYSPLLFGNIWLTEMGFKESDMNPGIHHMVGGFLLNVCQAFGLSFMLNGMHLTTLVPALDAVLTVGITLVAAGAFNAVIWEKRSLSLYFVNMGWALTSLALMTTVLIKLA